MFRSDSQFAFYQVGDKDTKSYAVQCASGTTAYLDASPGWYDCWAPGAAAGEHFRWKYLPAPDPASLPTISTAELPAPTAAVSGQTPRASGMAPATAAPLRLFVESGQRLAILYSAAGAVTLYCVKVL